MVRLDDEQPSPEWASLDTYRRFLEHALTEANLQRLEPRERSIRIEVWGWLRRPWLALGPLDLVAVSPGLRRVLRGHLRTGAFVSDGPHRLFEAVAWVEMWGQLGAWGWVRYSRELPAWVRARAQRLTRDWLLWCHERCLDRVWVQAARRPGARKIPPAPPGTVKGDSHG